MKDGKEPKEHTVKLRVNYRYEVNNNIYPHLLEFRKQKEKELKEKFEFGGFDAYIYHFIQKNDNRIDLDAVKQEKHRLASENADKILHQVKLMKELGYLEEKEPDVYSFQSGFKDKLDNAVFYLNTAEMKIVEFIEKHGVFSLIYTEEKQALIRQTFQYTESDVEFYNLIKSRGGIIRPEEEIKSIMDSINKDKGMIEVEAYNMIMRNYKCLGTADIDADDKIKLNVKLGYIVQNEDGTLSLTPKGKNLVNAVHLKDSEKKLKALSNKKLKLLNDIDKKFNRLDPKVYIKTQKLIADREKRRTVNLLQYKPEMLYLLGFLQISI